MHLHILHTTAIKVVKNKKSEDLSVASWFLWSVSSLADLIYSITLGRIELIIASISEFILILATLILTIYYEQQKSHAKNNEKNEVA